MKRTCLVIVIVMLGTLCCNYAKASPNVEGQTVLNSNIDTRSQVCEPQSTKMQDCNRCRCSANGLGWMCTKKACPKFIKTIPPNGPGFICTPNKVFRYECSTCTCNEHGNHADCIELGCDDRTSYTLQRKSQPVLLPVDTTTKAPTTTAASRTQRPDECTPGSRWQQDCNWCYCTSTGIAACTLRGCLGKINLPAPAINHSLRKRQTINQYQPTSGGETIYKLEDLQNPNFTCTPSLSFKVDCNTCWCAADGKRPRYCTRIACNPRPASQPIDASTKRSDIPTAIIFPHIEWKLKLDESRISCEND